MAVLDAQNRRRTWAHIMRQSGAFPPDVVKGDLRAALDATDTWIENNQGAFNAALPEPYKTAATAAQKTLLFCYVAMRRAGLLTTEAD